MKKYGCLIRRLIGVGMILFSFLCFYQMYTWCPDGPEVGFWSLGLSMIGAAALIGGIITAGTPPKNY